MDTKSVTSDRTPRLRLAKDLAVRALPLLDPTRPDPDAIQGVVVLVQALEISLQTALDFRGITPPGDRFAELVAALPETVPLRNSLADLYKIRNAAQHKGIPPPMPARGGLRATAVAGLRTAFAAAGSDYDRFSSVDQIGTEYFREPLALARSRAASAPEEAAALVGLAYRRVTGWASQLTGDALIPNEMWVFGTPLWSDMRLVTKCADNREDFVTAMLAIAGGQALGLSVAELLRLRLLAAGHDASLGADEPRFTHADDGVKVTKDEADWMTELVARSILRLEEEWPEFVLIPAEDDKPATPQ